MKAIASALYNFGLYVTWVKLWMGNLPTAFEHSDLWNKNFVPQFNMQMQTVVNNALADEFHDE